MGERKMRLSWFILSVVMKKYLTKAEKIKINKTNKIKPSLVTTE